MFLSVAAGTRLSRDAADALAKDAWATSNTYWRSTRSLSILARLGPDGMSPTRCRRLSRAGVKSRRSESIWDCIECQSSTAYELVVASSVTMSDRTVGNCRVLPGG